MYGLKEYFLLVVIEAEQIDPWHQSDYTQRIRTCFRRWHLWLANEYLGHQYY